MSRQGSVRMRNLTTYELVVLVVNSMKAKTSLTTTKFLQLTIFHTFLPTYPYICWSTWQFPFNCLSRLVCLKRLSWKLKKKIDQYSKRRLWYRMKSKLKWIPYLRLRESLTKKDEATLLRSKYQEHSSDFRTKKEIMITRLNTKPPIFTLRCDIYFSPIKTAPTKMFRV